MEWERASTTSHCSGSGRERKESRRERRKPGRTRSEYEETPEDFYEKAGLEQRGMPLAVQVVPLCCMLYIIISGAK